MESWRPGLTPAALRTRAHTLRLIREFFAERQVLEVDTPALGAYGVTDPAIEPLQLASPGTDVTPRYLQSSPEFSMKRLLAAGSGDIYQLGKVFRDGEQGGRHNPEFTMLEWYRQGFSLRDLMDDVAALVERCLQRRDLKFHRYRELFMELLGLDPWTLEADSLRAAASAHLDIGNLNLDRDGWLDLLMSHCIEPQIAEQGLVFVYDYPATQAALARCHTVDGTPVADRFELYVDGLELANGYRELLDPVELERRAAIDNERRRAADQPPRDLDPRLVDAMTHGLPDCSGVALGVDRLIMLQLGVDTISEAMPFDWSRA